MHLPGCELSLVMLLSLWGASSVALRGASQCLLPNNEIQLTAEVRTLNRLGGTGDMGECHYPQKPKWMRWKTFDREMAKAREAREANAMHLSCGLARFGGPAERF